MSSWKNAPVVQQQSWKNAPVVNQSPSDAAVMGESLTRQVPSAILGFPGDMIGLARDTLDSGYHLLKDGPDAPYQPLPPFPGGSEWFKNNVFGQIADRNTYTPNQKLKADVVEFGVPALVGGLTMASKAKSVASGASKVPSLFAPMFEQYVGRPNAQIAQDVASAVGAAGGKNLAEDQDMGPIGTLLLTLGGGALSGYSAAGLESGLRNFKASRPLELADGVKTTGRTLDDVRQIVGDVVTDKNAAVQNIDDSLRMSQEAGISAPTLGPASGDVGLSMLEVKQRSKTPRPFLVKDQQIRTDIAENMNKFSNPDADVSAPQVKSQAIIDDTMLKQRQGVDALYQNQAGLEQTKNSLEQQAQDIVAPVAARRGADARASRMINDQIGTEGGALGNITKQKNQRFEDAAKGAYVDAHSLAKLVDDVNAEAPKLAPDARLPDYIMEGINKFIAPEGTIEGPGSTANKIPADEVLKLRQYLSKEISALQSRGEYTKADTLSSFKSKINQTIELDPQFAEANAFYKQEYAPRFAEGYGRKFRDLVYRGTGVGTDDADKVAGIFLNGTKAAKDDLNKIREIVPDQKAFDNAEEMYFDAMLAKKELNPANVRKYLADNQDILPSHLKNKYQNLVQEMMGNETEQSGVLQKITDLKKTIRDAEGTMRSTEGQLRVGPFGKMSSQDADKYIDSIMNSDDRLKQLDQVVEGFKGDKKASEGFKEATVRWMQKKIRGTAAAHTDMQEVDAAGRPVLYSKLTKVFDDNREALSKIFTPDEMNDLNRVHVIMAKQGNLSRRATTGSDTTEKLSMVEESALNLIESAINLKYGLVSGGMANRVVRTLSKGLFAGQRKIQAEELLTQMSLNPKVAKEVLNATPLTVENGQTVNRIIAAMAAQDVAENNKDTDEKLTP